MVPLIGRPTSGHEIRMPLELPDRRGSSTPDDHPHKRSTWPS